MNKRNEECAHNDVLSHFDLCENTVVPAEFETANDFDISFK